MIVSFLLDAVISKPKGKSFSAYEYGVSAKFQYDDCDDKLSQSRGSHQCRPATQDSQSTFTSSKLTIETLEQGVKYVQS